MDIDAVRKNKKVIKIALWIKEYAHALRVVAGMFFVLALATGVVWMVGKDVEPIAYVFCLVSSLLFASPSIAEYVVPSRKPVRHMDYEEILEFIRTTNAETDWKWVKTNWAEEAFLKEDPRLRIRVRLDDQGIHVRKFKAPWANKYPDPTANSYWYDLSYDSALIERFILVSVDGARAELPLPDRSTLEVEPLIYKVAQIFDELNTLEEYMRSSGLSVKNS
ncbi:MAG: hypothetical protein OEU36_12980 [Gammaproteobacteria bacterium]|nr:hypothetical protein [Gammaproteobacteria bacterium]